MEGYGVTGELRRAWRGGGDYGRTLTRAGHTQEPSTSTTTTNIALASNTALALPPPPSKRRQIILDSAETKDPLARTSGVFAVTVGAGAIIHPCQFFLMEPLVALYCNYSDANFENAIHYDFTDELTKGFI